MKLIAHRSGPCSFPEQTIASAREALALGADLVEIDVRYTADRQIAITHDQNVSRVFGEDVHVCDLTAVQFRALRHASDASFGSHLLEDYLRCGVAPLLIHIKETELIEDMMHLLARYDYLDRVVLGVQRVDSVQLIRSMNPHVCILSFGPSPEAVADFIAAGVDYVRLWESWLTPDRVRRVKDSPAKLWVMSGAAEEGYPVGEPSPEGLRRIAACEPDGILINNLRYAKQVLNLG